MQAAILLEKLNIYEEEVALRQKVAFAYCRLLKQSGKNIKFQHIPEGLSFVYAQFCIEVESRDDVMVHLKDNGIPNAVYYIRLLHALDAFSSLGYQIGDHPISEEVSNRILALSMHPYLEETAIKKICQILVSK